MKNVRSYLHGALGILVLCWLVFRLSRWNHNQSANVPVPSERPVETPIPRNPPVEGKTAAANAAKNISPRTTQAARPVAMMRNASNSTARSALETELYALRQGDPDLVASVITFDLADKSKIVDLLPNLPLEIRKQYPTPERLVGFLLMGGQRMESIAVLAETPPRSDIVVQHVRYGFLADPTIHDGDIVFSRDSDGWKNVIPLGLIKRIADAMKSAPSK